MRHILIHTDHPAFEAALTRKETPPHGVSLRRLEPAGDGTVTWLVHVNFRTISATAFALWILRKIRSVPGHHRIEIGGKTMPTNMPEAIDVIANAVVARRRRAAA